MESLALFFSATGRIARKPFALGALVIYVASFLTQFALAAPVTARAGFLPFIAAQAAIGWSWYALHAKRLRDAGRPTGSAIALTLLYALTIALLLLVVALASASAPATPEHQSYSLFDMFLVFFLFAMIVRDPNAGVFGYVILGVLSLVLLPLVIAVAYTVWIGSRSSTPALAAP